MITKDSAPENNKSESFSNRTEEGGSVAAEAAGISGKPFPFKNPSFEHRNTVAPNGKKKPWKTLKQILAQVIVSNVLRSRNRALRLRRLPDQSLRKIKGLKQLKVFFSSHPFPFATYLE
jgi:hypothetical protein